MGLDRQEVMVFIWLYSTFVYPHILIYWNTETVPKKYLFTLLKLSSWYIKHSNCDYKNSKINLDNGLAFINYIVLEAIDDVVFGSF